MSGVLDPSYSIGVDQQGDLLNVNSNGSIWNAPNCGVKQTFSIGSQGIAVPLLATDIFTISGSSTKIIRLTRVEVTGTQSVAGQVLIILIKHLNPNTGGTATNYTTSGFLLPNDSNNQGPTATVLQYSANPTLGSPNSNLRSAQLFVPAAATVSTQNSLIWDFGNRPGQAAVLRSANEVIGINLNATTITGGTFWVNFEWTEE